MTAVKVLITGGAGFIGSTIASAFAERGATPVVLDSLVTGRTEFTAGKVFYRGDIGDGVLVDRIFAEHPDIAAAVHCAALIVVPDSVRDPSRYYRVNLTRTLEFAEHLRRNHCDRMVFASTAGMYRPSPDLSVTEASELDPRNPYTRSKAMAEAALRDLAGAYGLRVVSLRYLNPIGADPKMRTGLQSGKPTHALGKMIESYETGVPFKITGVEWPTRDGTAIRDYIHVWDIARAFVTAVERFDAIVPPAAGTPPARLAGAPSAGPAGALPASDAVASPARLAGAPAASTPGAAYQVVNLGTGDGTTVRELVEAFRAVVGDGLVVEEAAARPGDVVGAFVDPAKAWEVLGWRPEFTIGDAIRHSLQWAEHRRRLDVVA
ncbi:NAD-dependent epimerase/dehydratase family protein [Actinomadura rupiterrae]|uniref:NAD-dependent epimerase/dehydratase family protein n=1 Tax=Actinomadura rupiterrae TaxID=559627 RepID=UPI0020A2B8A7|nr:NAD-dependent epimerase/dehydratase family protein [Actinomadura rupiterrae]MCP2335055.1 UDP-glucose 4-epimerase [Actinomadura rupiterrae]MCP2339592.1 UDP-glucose 4-epimerase [Actinomadura rupiterrae]